MSTPVAGFQLDQSAKLVDTHHQVRHSTQWWRNWGGGVWAMAGVQGKVAFGLSHFCIEVFQKKF